MVNFFLLSPGMQRQFVLIPDPSQSKFVYFLKYWLFFRIIGPFLLFNTMELIFRYITIPFRSYPDFYFLGPKKVGSTTLAHHLLSIGLKGPYTFWNESTVKNKESLFYTGFLGLSSWFSHHTIYRLHFPLKIVKNIFYKDTLFFDADPANLHLPYARDRIYESSPNAKFLVMTRDPIKRAVSNFKHEAYINNAFHAFGLVQSPSFENDMQKMIDIERSELIQNVRKTLENLGIDQDLPESVNLVDRFSLIEQSLYDKQLKWWMQKFPKEQFYIVSLEDLNNNLHGELKKICKFLNYPITKQQLISKCKHIHANKEKKDGRGIEIDPSVIECLSKLINE